MKKLLVGLIAAILMAGGLVATTSVSAQAAPYPGTVKTMTKASSQPAKARHASIKVSLSSKSGKPKGNLTFTFVNKKTGKSVSFKKGAKSGAFSFGLKPGNYTVTVRFIPKKGSKWKPSSSKTSVKVKKK